MVKSLVFLLAIASVAMFAWVLRTPGRLLSSANFWQDDSEQTSEKADAKLTASLAARVANFSTRREAPTARRTSPDTAGTAEIRVPTKAPVKAHPVKSDVFSSKVLTISGDSASLYAMNSSKSNVLRVLSKGTIVEPNFQLIDAAENFDSGNNLAGEERLRCRRLVMILEHEPPHTALFGQAGQVDRVDRTITAVGSRVRVNIDHTGHVALALRHGSQKKCANQDA